MGLGDWAPCPPPSPLTTPLVQKERLVRVMININSQFSSGHILHSSKTSECYCIHLPWAPLNPGYRYDIMDIPPAWTVFFTFHKERYQGVKGPPIANSPLPDQNFTLFLMDFPLGSLLTSTPAGFRPIRLRHWSLFCWHRLCVMQIRKLGFGHWSSFLKRTFSTYEKHLFYEHFSEA